MEALIIALYFIPSIIAAFRGHHATFWIFFLNLCFGWTLVGYGIALIWSFCPVQLTINVKT